MNVSVIGSGSEAWPALAGPLGRLIARLGANLITGGGGGVMAAVAESFTSVHPRRGTSVGVLPCSATDPRAPPAGYPGAHVEVAVRTHLPDRGAHGDRATSRNHIVVLSADAIVALPGGAGTTSELRLAACYGRPAIIYCIDPADVIHFPDDVPRTTRLPDVEAFLISIVGSDSEPREEP